MTWDPDGVILRWAGEKPAYSIGAVEGGDFPRCPLRAGLQARRAQADLQVETEPFGDLLTARFKDMVIAIANTHRHGPERALRSARLTYRNFSRLELYLDKAAENYLEFLEAREAQVGLLTYVDYSLRAVVTKDFDTKVWAPVFTRDGGAVEIHRLRFGSAQEDHEDWAVAAAWVATRREPRPTCVSVIEVGLLDGTEFVVLDEESPESLHDRFAAQPLESLKDIHQNVAPVACADCASCSAVAVCTAPIAVDMLQGEKDSNPWVRSLSAADLRVHTQCPRRWFLRSRKLPRDTELSPEMQRGILVHERIASFHLQGNQCHASLLDGVSDPVAQAMLAGHVSTCSTDRDVVTIEETLTLWDSSANLVMYMKPDELLRERNSLVVRERKTTAKTHLVHDRAAARDEFHDVIAWSLAALDGGLAGHFGAGRGVVELEVLTAEGSAVHEFEVGTEESDALVAAWIDGPLAQWLLDTEWPTKASPSCATCELRRWCPEGIKFS